MWRNLGMRDYDTVYLLVGLSESLLHNLSSIGHEVARRERLRGAATDALAVPLLPEEVGDDELMVAARATGHPLGMAISGDRAAVYLPHELADGVEGTRLLGVLLRAASGEPVGPRSVPVRMPLGRALVAGGRPAVRAYLAGRDERRATGDPASPVPLGEGRFSRLTLVGPPLKDLRRMRSPGGRASPMTRVASVALAALAATADPRHDVRVVLPADLRHLVGGRRVSGNFVSTETYGTLRGTDWSAASISHMIAARRATGAVPLAASATRAALSRGRHGEAGPPGVLVSLLGTVDLPNGRPGVPPLLAAITVGTSAGTFVFAAQVGAAITVSLWDDTDAFDVAAFPDAFRSEMRSRTPS